MTHSICVAAALLRRCVRLLTSADLCNNNTGLATRANIADAFVSDPSQFFQQGQSVQALVVRTITSALTLTDPVAGCSRSLVLSCRCHAMSCSCPWTGSAASSR